MIAKEKDEKTHVHPNRQSSQPLFFLAALTLLLSVIIFPSAFAGASIDPQSQSLAADLDSLDQDLFVPEIVATITPTPNSNGWNNTNVRVHFAATNNGSRVVYVTSDVILSNDTDNAEVIGVGFDKAGSSTTNSVYLNIDKSPPTLTLKLGNGQTFDDSCPLLVIDYSDKSTSVPEANPSDLDLDSFRTTLDGKQVTDLFYRFSNRALAMVKHIPAGTHTWVASIADMAGNVTTVSNIFTATGTVNSNAPVMNNLDLTDDVTIVPDWSQIWVQGKVSGQKPTVGALVNGSELVQLNRREDDFGFYLSLDSGTNVIVLIASDDGGQNRSAQLLKVERSDKYSLSLTSPAFKFGKFANGKAQATKGTVSYRFADHGTNELTLVSVKVNGIAASLSGVVSNGVMNWDGVTLPPPSCTNSIVPIIVSLSWTGRTASGAYTNLLMNVPLDFLEAFEIVQRKSTYAEFKLAGKYPSQTFEQGNACGFDRWIRGDYSFECDDEFNLSYSSGIKSTSAFYESDWLWTCSEQEPEFEEATYDQSLQEETAEKLLQPSRGLSFGRWGWQTRHAMADGVVFVDGLQVEEDSSLTFRTPFHMERGYPDIFTFIGVEGGALSNLIWKGNSPVAFDDVKGTVSYLLTLDGATEYTISQSSFKWTSSGTNSFTRYETNDAPQPEWHLEWYSEDFQRFSFSDFDQ